MSENERITENIVRNMLHEKGYYSDKSIITEEQKSKNPTIDKLLSSASKSGVGKGYPDFIISFNNKPDQIIIIECKANSKLHKSQDINKYKHYAVDGALLYAGYLKNDFNVVAIGISGQTNNEIKVSTYIWLKNNISYKALKDQGLLNSQEISDIILRFKEPIAEEELHKKAIFYSDKLHSYSITANLRCTLICAILIALQHQPFLEGYKSHEYTQNKELIDSMLSACRTILQKNQLEKDKIEIILHQYEQIKSLVTFTEDTIVDNKNKQNINNTFLRDFITEIKDDILPYVNTSKFDILGKFYTSFIKHIEGNKKNGIVLTPTHITDFFCELAELTKDDIVFDPCCGTGGFLVSAMNYMIDKADNDQEKHKQIKSNQLLGIEKEPHIFTHACANMMMRGDGKSYIFFGDFFNNDLKNKILSKNPTVSFLNPPYKNNNASEQLKFVENSLDCIVKGGKCIAICQMSTVVSAINKDIKEIKERLLKKHTLQACLSMPNDLFHPVGVTTCILVFKAHIPHNSDKETFFGYFKDDGFKKSKDKGRFDANKIWDNIKNKWLQAYKNKKNILNLSITKNVNAEDEWCAEAYMETDYSQLKEEDFIQTLKKFTIFLFEQDYINFLTKENFYQNKKTSINTQEWGDFKYKDIFNIERGKSSQVKSDNRSLLIGASQNFNGSNEEYIYESPHYKEPCITVGNGGNVGCGQAFYQNIPFNAKSTVNILSLNDKKQSLNSFIALFLVTLIKKEQYRFDFGRGWSLDRMQNHKIKLPITKEGNPDWQFMEDYIKSLPYSKNL
jgi:type I restriction enzyme M protein